MKLTSDQVMTICKGDPEIAAFVHTLLNTIETQAARIKELEHRVHELERQLGSNSKTSSKPPSSDGLRKPTNLRTPGGKKGAPKGHPGSTLRFVEHPDEIILHGLSSCPDCQHSLTEVESQTYEKRQVFELPPPRIVTTEHRAEKKYCSHCCRMQRASFPEQVAAPVQYGTSLAVWTVYLHAYQMLPLDRIAQLFADLTGQRPSEGTLLTMLDRSYTALEPVEQTITEQLLATAKLHADETGCRVGGKTHWMHVVSDEAWTLLRFHALRGSQAMDTIDVLPRYTGTVVHDCMQSYFNDKYRFEHALCNAHLLRECQGIAKYDGHTWPVHMIELLKEGWRRARASRQAEESLEPAFIQTLKDRYDTILEAGKREWELDTVRLKTSTKGRKIQSKAGNLGQRLSLHKEAILSFLWRPHIPFDNNQAERDLRMVKVKQKVSGAFRTESGAAIFARLRSAVSTFIKQGHPVLTSLSRAIHGQPVL